MPRVVSGCVYTARAIFADKVSDRAEGERRRDEGSSVESPAMGRRAPRSKGILPWSLWRPGLSCRLGAGRLAKYVCKALKTVCDWGALYGPTTKPSSASRADLMHTGLKWQVSFSSQRCTRATKLSVKVESLLSRFALGTGPSPSLMDHALRHLLHLPRCDEKKRNCGWWRLRYRLLWFGCYGVVWLENVGNGGTC